MGLVRLGCKRWYWETWDKTNGLLGNDFFKGTMGQRLFRAIDRCIQADLQEIVQLINSINKSLWKPFPLVAFDDDLDLWKGKGGRKKHIAKKADGTGQANWKIVDQMRYCYFMFYEVDTPHSTTDPPLAQVC